MIDQARIISSIDSLPSLSATVLRLSKLVKDEHSDAGDVEEAVRLDPAITANLLRVANSSFFGATKQITSARHAITLIGLKRVFEASVGASMVRIIPERIPGYEMDSASYWKHCVAVAVLAERIAEIVNVVPPDLLFTAGLLHDIGKLAIGQFLDEEHVKVTESLKEGNSDFISVEFDALGVQHADIGAEIAKRWNFPDAIIWAIRWHHSPSQLPADVDPLPVCLVHAADGLAHMLGFGFDKGELARAIDPKAIEQLGLKTADIEKAASAALDEITDMGDLFNSGEQE